MPREIVDSRALRTFQYDGTRQHLYIEFTSGRAYRYLDVPQSTVDAFKAADSKGRFYNDHIRDVFLCVRLR